MIDIGILPECISLEEMALYHLGEVSEKRTTEIDRHLHTCMVCRGVAEEMAEAVQAELEGQAELLTRPTSNGVFDTLVKAVRGLPRLFSSMRPGEALQSGLAFAPDGTDRQSTGDICYLNHEIRWRAPIEAGIQYVYVETTKAATVMVMVASSRPGSQDEGVSVERECVQIPVRGTPFRWRMSHRLGAVEELIDRYGRDYQVTVAVSQ